MTFCPDCKTLMKYVDGKWVCPRCNAPSEKKHERRLKKGIEELDKEVEETPLYEKRFETSDGCIGFFESRASALTEAGYDLADFDRLYCSNKKKNYSIYLEFEYLRKNSVIYLEFPKGKVPYNCTGCNKTVCVFEVRDIERLRQQRTGYAKITRVGKTPGRKKKMAADLASRL